MSVGAALDTYSILTIGDGLVSQIPSLMIAFTAGIIVTRVASEDSPALGQEIGQQILAQPRAVLIAGIMLLLFALVPGFPKPQFLQLGSMLTGLGIVLTLAPIDEVAESGMDSDQPASPTATHDPKRPAADRAEFAVTVPLSIQVSQTLKSTLQNKRLETKLDEMRHALFMDLGVPVPTTQLQYVDSGDANSYRILVQEVPIADGFLRPGSVIARDSAEHLEAAGVSFESDKQFLPHIESIWVDAAQQQQLTALGISCMNPEEIITYHLACVMRMHAGQMIGLQETRTILDHIDAKYPELSKEVQRVLPIQRLSQVFSRLVEENISIRNMRAILEALIEWAPKEKDTVLLVEYVRSSLKQYISYRFSGGQSLLASYVLTPETEEAIRKAVRQSSSGSYLALDPKLKQMFQESLKQTVGDLSQATQKPVVLTAMDIRRYIKKLVEIGYDDVPVLSYQELTDQITVQPLGKIAI